MRASQGRGQTSLLAALLAAPSVVPWVGPRGGPGGAPGGGPDGAPAPRTYEDLASPAAVTSLRTDADLEFAKRSTSAVAVILGQMEVSE